MSDYIERETVLRRIEEMRVKEDDYAPDVAQAIYDFVVDMDAADVAPVRHERWRYKRTTDDGFAIVECTGCGDEAFAIAYTITSRSFCPNCSAKMDGGDDDATDHV